jgi:hypothetical protein
VIWKIRRAHRFNPAPHRQICPAPPRGLFKGAKGKAAFMAVFGQGIAFYIVAGNVSPGHGE